MSASRSAPIDDTQVPDPPSPELLRRVGLSQEEYERACRLAGRKLNLVELGIFGAMWSEHCSYKTSRRHLKRLPVEGKRVLQGPGENAGVMDLGNGWAVAFKIESHNHPSAVEPFQGATTGVGGIIRDIFAMGARPVALLNSLRFGNLATVAAVGVPEQADQATKPVADAAALPEQGTARVNWTAEPKPYVFTITWMTAGRRQVFQRANLARAAVNALRSMHDEALRAMAAEEPVWGCCEVLAWCVMPDQIVFAGSVAGGNDEAVAQVAAVLKARLAQQCGEALRPGEPLWESGYRAQRRHDQSELDEAVKRIEYTPVQRGAAKSPKEYQFVSQVWRFGTAWHDAEGQSVQREVLPLPFCHGVSAEQAARNRYLLGGVVGGIAHYGNCIGIPTVGGEVGFDPSYSGNCIVNAMCVGVMRASEMLRAVASGPGNTALYAGAKTGRDGVQGATFASAELHEASHSDRPAVQVGDPFMEKLLLEATLEARKLPGLIGVQDFGAAGLTCSGVEMAARAGTGMRLNLDAVPQRAKDLSAYEMMLSESQERMMLVVERGKEQPFIDLFAHWGLSAVPCGEVQPEQRLLVVHKGREVARLPNAPLASDAPVYDRPAEEPAWYRRRRPLADSDVEACLERVLGRRAELQGAIFAPETYGRLLQRLLADPGLASKRPVYQQYDFLVRGDTVLGPGEADAAVVRIKETGQGLAMATDCCAREVYLDPRAGAARAVLEAARNVLAVGSQPLGITNNLNFGNPEKPDRMWQFVQAIEGMREALLELELPVTGGNVSFYNESALPDGSSLAILPTPVIGMLGLLEDWRKAVRGSTEAEGLELFLLGSAAGRLDGSALCFDLGRLRAGELGASDYREFRSCEKLLLAAARDGALAACHDISDGGLAVALTELCAGGADVELGGKLPLPDCYDSDAVNALGALFAEDGQRWLLAVAPEQKGWLRTAALHYNAPLIPLGTTGGGRLRISLKTASGLVTLIDADMAQLRETQSSGLASLMG